MCDFKPNFRRAIIRSNVHTRLKSDSNTLPIDIKRGPREKVIRQKWIIAEENIPHLPFMHHLRSNHVEVTKFRPSIIARNIQQCLRKLSIMALFDNNKVNLGSFNMYPFQNRMLCLFRLYKSHNFCLIKT